MTMAIQSMASMAVLTLPAMTPTVVTEPRNGS